jgi:flagellar biosynthesis protein FlhF
MDVKTYRAGTMQEALALVRRELGPSAAVLHTREVREGRLWNLLPGRRQIEVTASTQVNVPSRFPSRDETESTGRASYDSYSNECGTSRDAIPARLQGQINELQSMVEQLCRRNDRAPNSDWPAELFHVYADLIDADVADDQARELVDCVRRDLTPEESTDALLCKARIVRLLEQEIRISGPIQPRPGVRHVVALVGPTGVGKTTTIAKLAANARLREKRRVGLLTVDTYRIAAVEQLRTYADIIDLPMEVVSTPREMRQALHRLADLDLVLMDTAGRSPRDEVKIQELKAFLHEAQADEVHLVQSSVAGAATLERTAEKFATVGTTSLILTKLDELTAPGSLLPILRRGSLPLSYLTNGQNVPDDIAPAEAKALVRVVLGLESPPLDRGSTWNGAS